MTSPDWGRTVNPSPTVHNPPALARPSAPALTPEYIGLIGATLLDLFLGQVALALGNINILGIRPFDFLAQWGQDRIDEASENFLRATTAQRSANYANTQLTVLTGGALASNVEGGVAVNAQFNQSTPSTTLAGFSTRVSDGPGGGTFGVNGLGQAVWNRSGGFWRRHIDIYDTPLATDYQSVFTLIFTPPEAAYLGGPSYTYLVARSNAAGTEFVFARIGVNSVAVGKAVSGTYTLFGSAVSVDCSAGDQWVFIVGTADDVREFTVRQNGVEVIARTDSTSSSYGASYRHVGVGSLAADRGFLIIPFFEQTRPAALDLWAAADRLASDEGGS